MPLPKTVTHKRLYFHIQKLQEDSLNYIEQISTFLWLTYLYIGFGEVVISDLSCPILSDFTSFFFKFVNSLRGLGYQSTSHSPSSEDEEFIELGISFKCFYMITFLHWTWRFLNCRKKKGFFFDSHWMFLDYELILILLFAFLCFCHYFHPN